MIRPPSLAIGFIVSVALQIAACAGASATGVARFQHADGTSDVYPGVTIHATRQTGVSITSSDRKGVFHIDTAACNFSGTLRRCFVTGVSLEQAGADKPIGIQTGTLYINSTDAVQPLPDSRRRIPPFGLSLIMVTAKGTLISIHGTIDRTPK